jgi:hypothetical protein
MPDTPATDTQTNNRERIAKVVTYFVLSLTAIILLGTIAIVLIEKDPNNGSKFDQFKDVISILLPLWGTWIGTVLAYYFSKDNFESANKSVKDLVKSVTSDKKLETIKAKNVMIPTDKLVYIEYKTGTNDNTLNLKITFLDFLTTKKIQRVILLDENKVAKYVLHKSMIQDFITEYCFSNPSQSVSALTFADLKKSTDATVQAILKDGIKFVSENANLSDAKTLIKNYTACNDVFITQNGFEIEPALGWITDKTIAENSVVN